jgi:nucleotidyltransferase substrate binding protein (TIGR01987 family)
MEKINEKISEFLKALKTLEEGVELFYKYENILDKKLTDENEQLFKSMRDSLIQRFEYCTDFFWKVTKVFLESEGVSLSINYPKFILREAVKARILSEVEGDECMNMVDSRNKTSHTYHEILAEEIAHKIPQYYTLMQTIVDRMQELMTRK